MFSALVALAVFAALAYGWWQGWMIIRIMAWIVFTVICATFVGAGLLWIGVEPKSPTAYLVAWPISLIGGWFISGIPVKIKRWQAKGRFHHYYYGAHSRLRPQSSLAKQGGERQAAQQTWVQLPYYHSADD